MIKLLLYISMWLIVLLFYQFLRLNWTFLSIYRCEMFCSWAQSTMLQAKSPNSQSHLSQSIFTNVIDRSKYIHKTKANVIRIFYVMEHSFITDQTIDNISQRTSMAVHSKGSNSYNIYVNDENGCLRIFSCNFPLLSP